MLQVIKKLLCNNNNQRINSSWIKLLSKCLGQILAIPNCGIGGDKVQHVLWCSHNLPIVKNIKK